MRRVIGLIATGMVGLVIVRVACAACGVWVPTFNESLALFFTLVFGGFLGFVSVEMEP